jgi:hypothetical protein
MTAIIDDDIVTGLNKIHNPVEHLGQRRRLIIQIERFRFGVCHYFGIRNYFPKLLCGIFETRIIELAMMIVNACSEYDYA